MIVNGISINVRAPARITNDFTFSVAPSIPSINFSIPTKANRGIAIAVRAIIPVKAPLAVPPMLFSIFKATDIVNNNADKAIEEPIADSGFIPFIKNMIPAKAPITAVIVRIGAMGTFFSPLRLFVINANIPINEPNATVAEARSAVSINDKAVTATAITPIATAIIMIDFCTF